MVDPGKADAPAWVPNARVVENANVRILMRKHDLATYDQLHAWSVANPEAFWESVVEELGISFF